MATHSMSSFCNTTGFSHSVIEGANSLLSYRIPKRPRQPDATIVALQKSRGYRRPREPRRRRLEPAAPEPPRTRPTYVPVGVRKVAIRKAQLERAAAWKATRIAFNRAADAVREREQRCEASSSSSDNRFRPIERAKRRRVVLDSDDEAEDDISGDDEEHVVVPGRRRLKLNEAPNGEEQRCTLIASDSQGKDSVVRKGVEMATRILEKQRKGCVSSPSSDFKHPLIERQKRKRVVLDSKYEEKEDDDDDNVIDYRHQRMERKEVAGTGNYRRVATDSDNDKRRKTGARRRSDSMEVTMELLDLFD